MGNGDIDKLSSAHPKRYTIERWPKLLVVHLKRFAPGERFRSKLSSLVSCPATGLDLR